MKKAIQHIAFATAWIFLFNGISHDLHFLFFHHQQTTPHVKSEIWTTTNNHRAACPYQDIPIINLSSFKIDHLKISVNWKGVLYLLPDRSTPEIQPIIGYSKRGPPLHYLTIKQQINHNN